MLSSARRRWDKSIRKLAHELLVQVHYVDVYGRNIGLEYPVIIAKIKEQFPDARTSRDSLRKMVYELDSDVRVPARRRSRQAAEGFAEVQLLRREGETGLAFRRIANLVRRKFPGQSVLSTNLRSLEKSLARNGFSVPPRPSNV